MILRILMILVGTGLAAQSAQAQYPCISRIYDAPICVGTRVAAELGYNANGTRVVGVGAVRNVRSARRFGEVTVDWQIGASGSSVFNNVDSLRALKPDGVGINLRVGYNVEGHSNSIYSIMEIFERDLMVIRMEVPRGALRHSRVGELRTAAPEDVTYVSYTPPYTPPPVVVVPNPRDRYSAPSDAVSCDPRDRYAHSCSTGLLCYDICPSSSVDGRGRPNGCREIRHGEGLGGGPLYRVLRCN